MSWHPFSATRRGSAHIGRDLPNQDAHGTWRRVSPHSGAVVAVIVADGHGDPRHSRSQIGARLAVEAVVTALETSADELLTSTGADAASVLRERVGPELLDCWLDGVAADLAADPARGVDVIDYGTTIVAAVATDTWVGALQLGDGEVVWVDPDGACSRPLPTDPLLDGVVTTSLCQPDALTSLRVGATAGDQVGLAFVCTDGFGVGRVDGSQWWRPVGEQLLAFAREEGVDWVEARLPGWLAEPADIGGDDVTVGVLARR